MNQPSEQNPTPPATSGDMTQPRKQDPRETAQESVHQITPKDDIKAPPKDDIRPPLRVKPNAGA